MSLQDAKRRFIQSGGPVQPLPSRFGNSGIDDTLNSTRVSSQGDAALLDKSWKALLGDHAVPANANDSVAESENEALCGVLLDRVREMRAQVRQLTYKMLEHQDRGTSTVETPCSQAVRSDQSSVVAQLALKNAIDASLVRSGAASDSQGVDGKVYLKSIQAQVLLSYIMQAAASQDQEHHHGRKSRKTAPRRAQSPTSTAPREHLVVDQIDDQAHKKKAPTTADHDNTVADGSQAAQTPPQPKQQQQPSAESTPAQSPAQNQVNVSTAQATATRRESPVRTTQQKQQKQHDTPPRRGVEEDDRSSSGDDGPVPTFGNAPHPTATSFGAGPASQTRPPTYSPARNMNREEKPDKKKKKSFFPCLQSEVRD